MSQGFSISHNIQSALHTGTPKTITLEISDSLNAGNTSQMIQY